LHTKEPGVLLQVAFASQGDAAHSSTSLQSMPLPVNPLLQTHFGGLEVMSQLASGLHIAHGPPPAPCEDAPAVPPLPGEVLPVEALAPPPAPPGPSALNLPSNTVHEDAPSSATATNIEEESLTASL
jgi:hypothetical protein